MCCKSWLRSFFVTLIIVSTSIGVWGMLADTQVEAARFGNSDWMYEMRDEIGDIPINRLIIPGSHDSFTSTLDTSKGGAPDFFNQTIRDLLSTLKRYVAGGIFLEQEIVRFVKDWGQTQTLSIKEQLEYGIRYFDFRMCGEDSITEISHCHGLYTSDGAMDVLNDIAEFHKAHPNELLILHYSRFSNLSQQTKNHFAQSILNRFGERMIPTGEAHISYSLNELWGIGKNVLVIYEDADARNWTYRPEKFWDEQGLMINGWADASKQNVLVDRVSANIDCRCNDRNKQQGANYPNKLFNIAIQPTADADVIKAAFLIKYAGATGTVRSNLMDYAYDMQVVVLDEITKKLKAKPWLRENMNIISSDVVSRMRLVEIVQEMNREFKLDRTPPVSVLRALKEPNEAGWHHEDVTLELTATDNDGGYGVRNVSYQVPGRPGHWHGDDHIQFEVNREGENWIWYDSSDMGSNNEERREMLIKLDKTAPEVKFEGVRDFGIDEHITVSCHASDSVSGLKDDPCTSAVIDRPAYELGAGTHTVTVTASDIADNVTEKEATFTIVANYDSLKYLEGLFVTGSDKEQVLTTLDFALKQAQKFENEGKALQRNQMLSLYLDRLPVLVKNGVLTDEHAEILRRTALFIQHKRFDDPSSSINRNSKVRYLALGDSLAAGVTAGPSMGLSYSDLLASYIRSSNYAVEFNKDYAVPGYTTGNLLEDIRSNKSGQDGSTIQEDIASADVITINIGANDVLQLLAAMPASDRLQESIQQAAANVSSILIEIRRWNAEADIYMLGLYDAFHSFPMSPAEKEQLNRVRISFNQALAESTVPVGAIFIPVEDAIAANYSRYLPDPMDIHPSEEGYKAIADAMWYGVVQLPYVWPADRQLAASQITRSSLTLEWNKANADVLGYVIYNGDMKAGTTVTESVYLIDGLSPDTSYSFKVEALLENGTLTADGPSRAVKTARIPEHNEVAPGIIATAPSDPNTIAASAFQSLIRESGTSAVLKLNMDTESPLHLPSHAGELLQNANKSLQIIAGGYSLTIPASILIDLAQLGGEGPWKEGQISLLLRPVEPSEELVDVMNVANLTGGASIQRYGDLVEFDLTVNAENGDVVRLKEFREPVALQLVIAPEAADQELLGIYYINENLSEWEYVGGTVNKNGAWIETLLTHNSKYAVLEFNKWYEDVPQTHWAHRTIQLLGAKHIVNGVSSEQFAPRAATTRAQFITMLVRALGIQPIDGNAGAEFQDVIQGEWYFEAVSLAVQAGIVKGIDEHRFAPHAQISREQMALILARAYEYRTGKQLDAAADHLSQYTDAYLISSWAQVEVNKAIDAGLMQGPGRYVFVPQGNATRAEAAQSIYNLLFGR